MKKKVGFVGLGVMGKPMVKNLLKAGYMMNVCDVNPEATKELTDMGAQAYDSPAAVARISDVVMTMLPDSPDVEKVYLGNNGLLTGAYEGLILIDLSTIDPETTRKIGRKAEELGINMLDAPVGGGSANAIAGNLIMLVGGDSDVLESVRDILETVGERIIHAGSLGAGESLKLANNLTSAIFACLLAEGYYFAENIGVDKEKLFELLSGNIARLCEILSKKIIEKDFKPGFMTRLMAKDLKIIFNLAQENGIPLPLAALVKQMYQFALNRGFEDLDFSSVFSIYSEKK